MGARGVAAGPAESAWRIRATYARIEFAMKSMEPPKSLLEQARVERPGVDDQELVRGICSRVIEEACAKPPVDVDLLASMCGIASVEYVVQPWAGMLVPDRGSVVARICATDGHERQRFTVLHESGHTFLPGFGSKREFRCNGEKTREELLCDLAAAELLFPSAYFRQDLRGVPFRFSSVEQLARRYEGSLQATALRVVDLATTPLLLMAFQVMHKPAELGRESEAEPKLRLAWSHGRGAWPYARQYKSVPDHSPFARAHAGEIVDETCHPGDLLAAPTGPLSVSARRYGRTVLALLAGDRWRT